MTAWSEWGIPDKSKLLRLNALFQPVPVADRDSDILMPSKNSQLPTKHLPNAQLSIYSNSGHGLLSFSAPCRSGKQVNAFLDR
ncbi:hypothetical protein [Streptomyces sp. NBC_00280]|uniref:hypothetical protein n=1 Tax=Streptomyces sp. NBC_00280 TaxID=2975699 RepID=UPI0032434405